MGAARLHCVSPAGSVSSTAGWASPSTVPRAEPAHLLSRRRSPTLAEDGLLLWPGLLLTTASKRSSKSPNHPVRAYRAALPEHSAPWRYAPSGPEQGRSSVCRGAARSTAALAEWLWRSVMQEGSNRSTPTPPEGTAVTSSQRLAYYNGVRPRQALANCTPAELVPGPATQP